jgi:hypothetical protein
MGATAASRHPSRLIHRTLCVFGRICDGVVVNTSVDARVYTLSYAGEGARAIVQPQGYALEFLENFTCA